MSVLETVLVFGVIPAGVVALLALLIFTPSLARKPRYRPGRPWEFAPVWYVPHPVADSPAEAATREPLGAGPTAQAQLPAAVGRQLPPGHAPASVLDAPVKTAKGGAHGSW